MGADLVVVGPEAPLVAGVADVVRARGIACFGPGREAAQLEGSKAFAKEVMAAAEVPTALAHVCATAAEVHRRAGRARGAVRRQGRRPGGLNKENMAKLKEELQAAVKKTAIMDKLKNQIEITITAEGLRIELMETDKDGFFPSGMAEPNNSGKEILISLAQELGKLPNTMSIEGHTDAKPFSQNANYGNWELSTDRANSARRLMQQHGLGPHQVTQVRGFADQQLRKPQSPEDPSNRRISLIAHYIVQPDEAEDEPAPPTTPAKKH